MQKFDHVAGDVDCYHDCSCRVTVCIADDFHCLKLGGREHEQHLRQIGLSSCVRTSSSGNMSQIIVTTVVDSTKIIWFRMFSPCRLSSQTLDSRLKCSEWTVVIHQSWRDQSSVLPSPTSRVSVCWSRRRVLSVRQDLEPTSQALCDCYPISLIFRSWHCCHYRHSRTGSCNSDTR